jgi:hypothetical protein
MEIIPYICREQIKVVYLNNGESFTLLRLNSKLDVSNRF